MSLKSDRWIRNQCIPPRYVVTLPTGEKYFIGEELNDREKYWRQYNSNTYIEPCVFEVTQAEYDSFKPMITPFHPESISSVNGNKILSAGSSSAGYDITPSTKFRVFSNVHSKTVDPLNFDPGVYTEIEGEEIIIPPNGFVLAFSNEHINVPRDIAVTVMTKSTYARCGVFCLCTPLEPEWPGYITLEFANFTPCPVKFYANQGCAQLLFHSLSEPCDVSYADRKGKYMHQPADIVNPKV